MIQIEYYNATLANITLSVASRSEAESALLGSFLKGSAAPYTHIISIGDPGQQWPSGVAEFEGPVWRLEFHDIIEPNPYYHADYMAQRGYCPPNYGHIKDIQDCLEDALDFEATNLQSPYILIHCEAGISRSAAVALIALCILTEGRVDAAANVFRDFCDDRLWPNAYLVELADLYLNYRGDLVAALKSYVSDCFSRIPKQVNA